MAALTHKAPKLVVGSAIYDYKITALIGSGKGTRVYAAVNHKTNQKVILKFDYSRDQSTIIHEHSIHQKLHNSPYVGDLSGSLLDIPANTANETGQILVTKQCCEEDLSDSRKKQENQLFGIPEGALLGVETIRAIEHVHNQGYVHRDVKPNNMGQVVTSNNIWKYKLNIFDFGLSETIKDATSGFSGTSMYASINTHEGTKKYTPMDDLWSVFYLIYDISIGVPWKQGCAEKENPDKRAYALNEKLKFNQRLLEDKNAEFTGPVEYQQMAQLLKIGDPEQPPYNDLVDILHELAMNEKYGVVQHDKNGLSVSFIYIYIFNILFHAKSHNLSARIYINK